ncbi:putative immunity protein [Oricola sp.]|uniref:putative immunity protein n=1 Tax=Oricola sp. TaxID=1979950 RepID=UPI003BAB0794
MGGALRGGAGISAAQAREAGCTFGEIACVACHIAQSDAEVQRRLRLWMADCAARVLHVFEETESSHAPRRAIEAARQFARGEIDDAASAAAGAAAGDAARAAATVAARVAAKAAARAAAGAAAVDPATGAARAASTWAARDAEREWQFDRLIAWMSDDEPEDWPLPERTGAE